MMVWALQKPEEKKHVDFVSRALQQGISRFGWSYVSRSDLRYLDDEPWKNLDDQQTDCYKKARFLLEVQPGDWVVHINIPQDGLCTAGQVVRGYEFAAAPNEVDDFRHTLGLDESTLVTFHRDDKAVLPLISRRLKLRGRYWRIRQTKEFEQTLRNLLTHD